MRAFKFLRGVGRKEKPAVCSGGFPEPDGSVSSKKDETYMTAVPLFSKPHSTVAGDQLARWIDRGRQEIFTVTTVLSPALAKALLANNPDNRNVINGTGRGIRSITAYADMMQRGEWVLNGSTLVVARSGELNDGQHRCLAAIRAEASVPVQITFGVERESRSTVDQGIARSTGTVLGMNGVPDANQVAVYLRFRVSVADGRPISQALTPDEALAAWSRFRTFDNYTVPVGGWAKRNRLSIGFMVGAHALCVEANPVAAAAYAEQVATGVGITSVNAPAARVRRVVEDQTRRSRARAPAFNLAALYVLGFNNFCRGKTGPLSWRDKDGREPFPQPVKA